MAILEGKSVGVVQTEGEIDETAIDLAEVNRDQIIDWIQANFAGHKLADLIEAILIAKGYAVYKSPPGPDQGVDLLASTGTMGFGEPRIAVQVKSQQSPVDSAVLNELKGAMVNHHATHGLIVAWGGFRGSYEQLRRQHYFNMRLWQQNEVLDELFAVYDQLPEDIRSLIPLQQVWTLR